MTNANIREAHRIIKNAGSVMTREQIDLLRSVLPPLPKQKTLEEITEHVYDAWAGTNGNEWPDDVHGELETWLAELHTQLQGVKSEPAPGLPAGMRIAVHAVYGRVVVSPVVDDDGTCKIFHLSTHARDGSDYCWTPVDYLTFIDAEPAAPAKPAHPEFLETEADYRDAPDGTIAAQDSWPVWMKEEANDWTCGAGAVGNYSMALSGRRRVLRFGWGNE